MENNEYKTNKLQVVDINKLETEEDIREAEDYLKRFRRRANFFTAACLYWTFDFGMTAATAAEPTLRYVGYALAAFTCILGGRCYLRSCEARDELPEVEMQRKKIIAKTYGFDRKC